MSDPDFDSHREEVDLTTLNAGLRVLTWVEVARLKAPCYIGKPDVCGIHRYVGLILDPLIEKIATGRCHSITATLHEDGSLSIDYEGDAISVEMDQKTGLPWIELLFTTYYGYRDLFTGEQDGTAPDFGGIWVGEVFMASALSASLRVTTRYQGKIYSIAFTRGETTQKLECLGNLETGTATGACITFQPDPAIFEHGVRMNAARLRRRLHELAYCYPALTLHFTDEGVTNPVREIISHPRGSVELLESLLQESVPLFPEPVVVRAERDGTSVEIAMQYLEGMEVRIRCFTNGIANLEGGSHYDGFFHGFSTAVTKFVKEELWDEDEWGPIDLFPGLIAVISVTLPEPRFSCMEKKTIENPISSFIAEAVEAHWTAIFAQDPGVGSDIVYRSRTSWRSNFQRQAE